MNSFIPYIYRRYAEFSYRADKEITVPRIDDYILNCVIYLYPTVESARNSLNVGGSGFIVGVQSKARPETFFTYAVTNAHVVNNGCTVVRVNKKDGTFDVIELADTQWIRHPNADDLAIASIVLDQNQHKLDFWVGDSFLITKEKIEELKIGIGDEAFIVGRFQLADGKIQNTPTVRLGHIAQMPIEPHLTEYQLQQEGFLVECHSISGFSGSPVFVYIPPFAPRPNTDVISAVWHRLLLGVDWGHLPIPENVKRWNADSGEWEKQKNLKVVANSAMMGVVPAWKLRELLDMSQFMKVRDNQDKQWEKEKKPASEEEVVTNDDLVLTEEQFVDALKKVSKKITPSQPDPSKPKT